jgi:hypothetical protein
VGLGDGVSWRISISHDLPPFVDMNRHYNHAKGREACWKQVTAICSTVGISAPSHVS